MQINILKFIDDTGTNRGNTQYIIHPDRIIDIYDTETGCYLRYANGRGHGEIKATTARGLKRSIQEQLDEPMGFLKTEYTHYVDPGKKYFNVNQVSAILAKSAKIVNNKPVQRCAIQTSDGEQHWMHHAAQDVAYQVRRIQRRLDQDEDICCAPDNEQEE